MEAIKIEIEVIEHNSAAEAIQYLDVSAHDRGIFLGGKHMTLTNADADKLEYIGAAFAYIIFDKASGQIITVPVDARKK